MAIYLDYAAATPVDPLVLQAMQPFWTDDFYNPSSIYQSAKLVKQKLEQARHDVAQIIGCQKRDIIFTAGGTEADNMAVYGVVEQFKNAHVVVSSIEHEAILQAANRYDNSLCAVDNNGVLELNNLKRQIKDTTVLVSVGLANNELGTIQPIKKIVRIVESVRQERKKQGNKLPIYVHSDASQAPGWLDLQVARLGVDLMTLNSGKIYGPKQTGCLYVKSGVTLKPLINGGGHERGLRSGTENVPAIIGFAKALQLAEIRRGEGGQSTKELRNELEKTLTDKIPNLTINGQNANRLPNFSNFSINGQDGERLVMELDELGVMVATGAACSAKSDEPSKILLAIGLTVEQANSSLRVSLSHKTTKDEIKSVINAIIKVVS